MTDEKLEQSGVLEILLDIMYTLEAKTNNIETTDIRS